MAGKKAGPIKAEEVLAWFQAHRKPWPTVTECSALAEWLNKDGPMPEMAVAQHGDGLIRDVSAEAQILLEALPNLVAHWESLLPTPETHAGAMAVQAALDALSRAMEYIQWPFGRYQPVRRRKHVTTDWHMQAVVIAGRVARLLEVAGHRTIGFSRGSIAQLIVQEALQRQGWHLSQAQIAQHLGRWQRDAGKLWWRVPNK